MLTDAVGRDVKARVQRHEERRLLAIDRNRAADHRRRGDLRQLIKDGLDLFGLDGLAAANDHVLRPVDENEITVLIETLGGHRAEQFRLGRHEPDVGQAVSAQRDRDRQIQHRLARIVHRPGQPQREHHTHARYPTPLAEAVLAADPLQEATWRTLMPIRSAVGHDGVITTFALCERALRAAGIAPAAATRALPDQLRR